MYIHTHTCIHTYRVSARCGCHQGTTPPPAYNGPTYTYTYIYTEYLRDVVVTKGQRLPQPTYTYTYIHTEYLRDVVVTKGQRLPQPPIESLPAGHELATKKLIDSLLQRNAAQRLSMAVCMYVCINSFVYVCIHVHPIERLDAGHTFVCVCVFSVYVFMYSCANDREPTCWAYIGLCVCVCVCLVCMYVCIHVQPFESLPAGGMNSPRQETCGASPETSLWAYVCMFPCMYVYMGACMCLHTTVKLTHIRMHACIYPQTYYTDI
jgi:hypothetical protein